MDRAIKFLHLIGMTMFLGSIAVFISITGLSKTVTLQEIAFGRAIISTATYYITVPGLWIAIATGVFMAFRRSAFKDKWIKLKIALSILIIINTHLWILHAIEGALATAKASVTYGSLMNEFTFFALTESVAGGANLILALVVSIAGIFKFGRRPALIEKKP